MQHRHQPTALDDVCGAGRMIMTYGGVKLIWHPSRTRPPYQSGQGGGGDLVVMVKNADLCKLFTRIVLR